MKIGIDSRFAVHKRRGIGKYTLGLIRHLALIDRDNEYFLYLDRDDKENVLPRQGNIRIRKLWPSNYPLWEQSALPIQAKKDEIDLLHCPGNTAPLYLSQRIKLVVTICDVMYLKNYSILPESPSPYQRLGRWYRKIVVPRIAKTISKAITISRFSRYDIRQHIRSLSEEDIKVVYLAANNIFCQNDKSKPIRGLNEILPISCNYILTLGGLDPRKNTELVIKTFIELKSAKKISEKLIIVGIPGVEQTKFHQMAQAAPCKDDIVFMDFVSDEGLVSLYQGAELFLYPSLYEGFGVPPLEAMSCGVPVITSNVTSIPEIVGDAAILISPENGTELKDAVVRLLDDENLRQELIGRGYKQIKKFSWEKTAKETLEIYKSLLEN